MALFTPWVEACTVGQLVSLESTRTARARISPVQLFFSMVLQLLIRVLKAGLPLQAVHRPQTFESQGGVGVGVHDGLRVGVGVAVTPGGSVGPGVGVAVAGCGAPEQPPESYSHLLLRHFLTQKSAQPHWSHLGHCPPTSC